jgi:hypothetical protein
MSTYSTRLAQSPFDETRQICIVIVLLFSFKHKNGSATPLGSRFSGSVLGSLLECKCLGSKSGCDAGTDPSAVRLEVLGASADAGAGAGGKSQMQMVDYCAIALGVICTLQ